MLESHEIILRGEIRGRVPRGTVSDIATKDGALSMRVNGEVLILDIGAAEAEKWAAILRKPPPSLARKLGLTDGAKAFAVGTIADPTLAASLDGMTTLAIAEAAYLIAEIHTQADLRNACTVAAANPQAPIWLIHRKGGGAGVTESDIRAALRAKSFVDTKSSAVSAAMTGTLYRARR